MEEGAALFKEFEASKSGIVFLRSNGAGFLGKASPRIPCFIGGCNDPRALGAVNNPSAPEGNITGVTYYIPFAKRFDTIMKLFPNIKTVGVLLEKGHPGTPIEQRGSMQECERLGLSYADVLATDREELLQGARKLAAQSDLLIISNSALVIDNTVNLLPIANQTRTPLFSFADKAVKSGAVAGVFADDQKMGAMLADSVADVLAKGKRISQVPVKMDPEPKVLINKPMMTTLELTFSESILGSANFIE